MRVVALPKIFKIKNMKVLWRLKETDLWTEFGLEIASLLMLQSVHYLMSTKDSNPSDKPPQGSG